MAFVRESRWLGRCQSMLLLSGVCCWALVAPESIAADWPAWRGPRGTGVSDETDLPLKWSPTENVKWRMALAERGNSTPIVSNGRVFVTQAVGKRRTLMCFGRAEGELIWQQGVTTQATDDPTHATNPYCSASPVTDGERVIVWFGSDGLHCYDFSGRKLWSRDLGVQQHIWGYGSSPVMHGDLCFLNFGPGARSFLIAVEQEDRPDRVAARRRHRLRQTAGGRRAGRQRWPGDLRRLVDHAGYHGGRRPRPVVDDVAAPTRCLRPADRAGAVEVRRLEPAGLYLAYLQRGHGRSDGRIQRHELRRAHRWQRRHHRITTLVASSAHQTTHRLERHS